MNPGNDMRSEERRGIMAGGNFIVDTVLTLDRFPEQEMLVTILREARTNGGGPYNVLCDLAALGADFPLAAVCLVGDDEEGRWIRQECVDRGIDVSQIRSSDELTTSHTYVMCVKETGRRTFLHSRGANSELDASHFDFRSTKARILHLSYLMLLERLDRFDANGSTGAAQVLRAARKASLQTSVDFVSVDHSSFSKVASAALPFVDHLILNEIEAGRILQRFVPPLDRSALVQAARDLLALGPAMAVALHTEAGGVLATETTTESMGSLVLPPGFCQGTNGAGDAFAAGYLYGAHEEWAPRDRLKLAMCAAATSLSDPSPSSGVLPVADCLELAAKFGERDWT